jgi:hypothetical protein
MWRRAQFTTTNAIDRTLYRIGYLDFVERSFRLLDVVIGVIIASASRELKSCRHHAFLYEILLHVMKIKLW